MLGLSVCRVQCSKSNAEQVKIWVAIKSDFIWSSSEPPNDTSTGVHRSTRSTHKPIFRSITRYTVFSSGHGTKTTHQQQLPGKGRPKRSETLLLRFVVDNKRWRQTQFAPIIVCRPGLQLDYVAMTTEHRISWRSSNCCRGNEQQYVTRRMKQTRCPDIQASIDDASPKRWRVLWRSPQWLAFNFQCNRTTHDDTVHM